MNILSILFKRIFSLKNNKLFLLGIVFTITAIFVVGSNLHQFFKGDANVNNNDPAVDANVTIKYHPLTDPNNPELFTFSSVLLNTINNHEKLSEMIEQIYDAYADNRRAGKMIPVEGGRQVQIPSVTADINLSLFKADQQPGAPLELDPRIPHKFTIESDLDANTSLEVLALLVKNDLNLVEVNPSNVSSFLDQLIEQNIIEAVSMFTINQENNQHDIIIPKLVVDEADPNPGPALNSLIPLNFFSNLERDTDLDDTPRKLIVLTTEGNALSFGVGHNICTTANSYTVKWCPPIENLEDDLPWTNAEYDIHSHSIDIELKESGSFEKESTGVADPLPEQLVQFEKNSTFQTENGLVTNTSPINFELKDSSWIVEQVGLSSETCDAVSQQVFNVLEPEGILDGLLFQIEHYFALLLMDLEPIYFIEEIVYVLQKQKSLGLIDVTEAFKTDLADKLRDLIAEFKELDLVLKNEYAWSEDPADIDFSTHNHIAILNNLIDDLDNNSPDLDHILDKLIEASEYLLIASDSNSLIEKVEDIDLEGDGIHVVDAFAEVMSLFNDSTNKIVQGFMYQYCTEQDSGEKTTLKNKLTTQLEGLLKRFKGYFATEEIVISPDMLHELTLKSLSPDTKTEYIGLNYSYPFTEVLTDLTGSTVIGSPMFFLNEPHFHSLGYLNERIKNTSITWHNKYPRKTNSIYEVAGLVREMDEAIENNPNLVDLNLDTSPFIFPDSSQVIQMSSLLSYSNGNSTEGTLIYLAVKPKEQNIENSCPVRSEFDDSFLTFINEEINLDREYGLGSLFDVYMIPYVIEEAPEPIACDANEVLGENDNCVCKNGYEENEQGACIRIVQPLVCGVNEELNANDDCVCKSGYTLDSNDKCIAETRPSAPRISTGSTGCSRHFSDFSSASYENRHIACALYDNGIFAGKPDPFRPGRYLMDLDGITTRAESFAVLARLQSANYTPINYALLSRFTDMPQLLKDSINNWYLEPLTLLVQQGSVRGYGDNTIRPAQIMSQPEVAKVIAELLLYQNGYPFKNNDNLNPWYMDTVTFYRNLGFNVQNVAATREFLIHAIYFSMYMQQFN